MNKFKYTIDNHRHEYEEKNGIETCKHCWLQKSTIESVRKQENIPNAYDANGNPIILGITNTTDQVQNKSRVVQTTQSWEEEWLKLCSDHEFDYVTDGGNFIRQTIKAEKLKLIELIKQSFSYIPDDLEQNKKHYYREETINEFFSDLRKEIDEDS